MKRFPYTLLFGAIAFLCYWLSAQLPKSDEINQIEVLFLTALLGIPLSLGIIIATEHKPWAAYPKSFIQTGLILVPCLLTMAYLSTGDSWSIIVHYGGVLALAHLLLTYAVNLHGGNDSDSYWNFNYLLLRKFTYATVVTACWYVGVVITIFTVSFLFKLDSSFIGDTIFVLSGFALFIFHPLLFCASFPADFSKIIQEPHPKVMRLLAHYALIPLVFLYFFVLYVYLGSELVALDVPKKYIAWLTSGASAVGLITLLTLLPLENSTEHRWVRRVNQLFYVFVLPLLLASAVSVIIRVKQYGFTEARYALLLYVSWLAVMAVLGLLKKASFRMLHLSFSLVVAFATLTPLSLSSVAMRSQKQQLQQWVAAHGLQDEQGKLKIGAQAVLSFEEINRFEHLVRHLITNYSVSSLAGILEKEQLTELRGLDSFSYAPDTWDQVSYVRQLVKLETIPVPVAKNTRSEVNWYNDIFQGKFGKTGLFAHIALTRKSPRDSLKLLQLTVHLGDRLLTVENPKKKEKWVFDLGPVEERLAASTAQGPLVLTSTDGKAYVLLSHYATVIVEGQQLAYSLNGTFLRP